MARRPLRPSDIRVQEEYAESAEVDGNLWDAIERAIGSFIVQAEQEAFRMGGDEQEDRKQ